MHSAVSTSARQMKWGRSLCPNAEVALSSRSAPTPAIVARRAQRQQIQPRAEAIRSGPPSQQARRRAEGSTEVAASSTSVDEPATLNSTDEDAAVRASGSMSASLLASIDEAYHGVTSSVHDAEVAVESAWQRSPPGKWWAAYTQALKTNPVRTKAMTSFVGFVLGDVMAQRIAGVTVLDPFRCLRLGCYGLFVDGPFGHLWYKVLDRNVEPENPNGLKAVLLKTAADQLFWAPIMTCVFFVVLKSLEGHPELIWPTIQDKLVKTIIANYILWPGAHFINFRFVPSEHRILYNNVVSVAWNAYLSTLSHDAVLDTSQLLDLFDNAEDMLNSWIPPQLVDVFASHDGLKGLQFDIPRTIDLKPTRTLLDFLPLLSEEKGI